MFSGCGNYSKAMRAKDTNWLTVEHDILHGLDYTARGLGNEFGNAMLQQLKRIKSRPRHTHMGTVCTSFSRANTKDPVRSNDFPEGLPHNPPGKREKAELGKNTIEPDDFSVLPADVLVGLS